MQVKKNATEQSGENNLSICCIFFYEVCRILSLLFKTSFIFDALAARQNNIMDTDELSTEAYKAIIIEADKFNHDLTLQFGVMASSCNDEKEYLIKANKLIKEIQSLDKYDLSDMFFGSPPDKAALNKTLDKILANITKVEKIPKEKRHYDF